MFTDFQIEGDRQALSSDEQVDEAQRRLGTKLPAGYREYVTTLGEGVLGGFYIRIYLPESLVGGRNDVEEWRRRIDEYWFWDDGAEILTKERALECVRFGDTLDGDELIIHPENPNLIYVLPRHFESIFVAGTGLPDAIEWLCSSGVLTAPFSDRIFEPFAGSHDEEV